MVLPGEGGRLTGTEPPSARAARSQNKPSSTELGLREHVRGMSENSSILLKIMKNKTIVLFGNISQETAERWNRLEAKKRGRSQICYKFLYKRPKAAS